MLPLPTSGFVIAMAGSGGRTTGGHSLLLKLLLLLLGIPRPDLPAGRETALGINFAPHSVGMVPWLGKSKWPGFCRTPRQHWLAIVVLLTALPLARETLGNLVWLSSVERISTSLQRAVPFRTL